MGLFRRIAVDFGFEPKRNFKLFVSPGLERFRYYVGRLEEGLELVEKLRGQGSDENLLRDLQIDGLRILASEARDYIFGNNYLDYGQIAMLNGLFENFVDKSRYLTLSRAN